MATSVEKLTGNGNRASAALADDFAWDYDYESAPKHLSDDEMIERYQSANEKHPGALISVNGHECGHWSVDVYATEVEKRIFFTRRITELLANALKLLR